MLYTSTRNSAIKVSAAQAIASGISEDGGLFLPVSIPELSLNDIEKLCGLSYMDRAVEILKLYLTDFSLEEIEKCVNGAYGGGKFDSPDVAPLVKLNDKKYALELWHGPTCAFKDMALQLLPHLLTESVRKTDSKKTTVILVATSGDTGKAALDGFKDVENTQIIVFYPEEGVSPMQKLQMITQEGENVNVCAIKGNFDNAQNGVKAIFTDKNIKSELNNNNMAFSSANSINWGRLAPQIVYYVSAYCDLVSSEVIECGDKINFVVPTGNFGNILAAYYAKMMGLPIDKLVCASNANNVLTDFIETGTYDKNREFFTTISPSMDILISSNLERLLYMMSGNNDEKVKAWMNELNSQGKYSIDEEMISKLQEHFICGYCDDEKTKEAINREFAECNYLCDTHTAVAAETLHGYAKNGEENIVSVIASTANPYKFPKAVLEALSAEDVSKISEFQALDKLNEITGVPIPARLSSLKDKEIRFSNVCEQKEMADITLKMLGIK